MTCVKGLLWGLPIKIEIYGDTLTQSRLPLSHPSFAARRQNSQALDVAHTVAACCCCSTSLSLGRFGATTRNPRSPSFTEFSRSLILKLCFVPGAFRGIPISSLHHRWWFCWGVLYFCLIPSKIFQISLFYLFLEGSHRPQADKTDQPDCQARPIVAVIGQLSRVSFHPVEEHLAGDWRSAGCVGAITSVS